MTLTPVVSTVFLLGAGILAAAITLVLRRTDLRLESVDPQPWSSTLQYVATAYGVVIGFSILFLFGGFGDARKAVGDEATSIGTAFDEVMVFERDAPAVQQALICYGRAASEYDWPAMRERTSAPEVDTAYSDLVLSLDAGVEPIEGTFDAAVATNIVLQVGSISTAREARIVAAETRLPVLLWMLLLGGGALVVLLIFVVTLPAPPRVQALLVGLATSFTAVLVLLVVALNNPFAPGAGRVSPELIDETVSSMEQAAPDLADQPCPVADDSP
jgi:hypothetical protein